MIAFPLKQDYVRPCHVRLSSLDRLGIFIHKYIQGQPLRSIPFSRLSRSSGISPKSAKYPGVGERWWNIYFSCYSTVVQCYVFGYLPDLWKNSPPNFTTISRNLECSDCKPYGTWYKDVDCCWESLCRFSEGMKLETWRSQGFPNDVKKRASENEKSSGA